MKRLVVIFFTFLFLVGCQNIEYPKKPKDLIPEDKMVDIMIDIHLYNVAKNYNRLPLQQTGMTPHEFIYLKHNVDSVQYERSNRYYGANLSKYGNLHNKVLNYLETEKTKLDTLVVRHTYIQDSIRRVNDSLRLISTDTTRRPILMRNQ